MPADVHFRLLGPLEVRLDGTPVAIGGRKQRALLALLLLNANRVVSRDRLIEELTDGDRSRSPEHALQAQVSRLRKALRPAGADRLAARPPGYVLRVEPGELDVEAFERLVADGRAAVAEGALERGVELLRRAESLWHGRPLPDVEGVDAEVRRLEGLRLTAIEDRVDAELELGRHAELVPELERLVRDHLESERLRGQQMLALYRLGRHPAALEAYRELHDYLRDELGLVPGEGVQSLQRMILSHDTALAERVSAVCPFKGLAPFESSDAPFFFGRERVVDELVSRLAQARLVAVLGPSGSGKSSVAQAGLLPALARGALPGSDRWRQAVMRPGGHPRAELRQHVLAAPLVLVVDQFEELFTACSDEAEQRRFVDALLALEARVVLTLRLDFYGELDRFPALAEQVTASHLLLRPLGEDELRRAIERPAERAELTIETRLEETLVRDVVREPGGLPLLSTTLLELWQEREGRTLTLASYERLGRLGGAVARLAETAYGRLQPGDQELARRVLLRLSGGGSEGEPVVRRRARIDDVARDADTARVVSFLTDARLLTAGEGTVEIAHEALLQRWPRLQEWLAADAEHRRMREHLAQSAREWEARGRDAADLYRGARLAAALEWAADAAPAGELTPVEREFLTESRSDAGRATRRLRVALVVAVLLLAAACAAVLVALAQWRSARKESTASEAGRLGAQALLEPRLDRALLLAREAVSLDDSLLTRSDLLAALLRSPEAIAVLHGDGDRVIAQALTSDGRELAIASDDGSIAFWDTATFTRSRRPSDRLVGSPYAFTPPPQPLHSLAYAPEGRLLAIGNSDGAEATLDLIDTARHRARRSVQSGATLTADVAFAPGGQTLYTGETVPATGPRQAELAEVVVARAAREGTALRRSAPIARGRLAGVTPDGRHVLVTAGPSRSLLLDARTLRRRRTYALGGIAALALRGGLAAFGRGDGTVVLLDVRSGARRTMSSRASAAIDAVVFSADGRRLATAAADGSVAVWNVRTASLLATLRGHSTTAGSPVFSPDGRTLYSSSSDGSVIVWDLAGDSRFGRLVRAGRPTAAAVAPDGRMVAVSTSPGHVTLSDTRAGREVTDLAGPVAHVDAIAFSPDSAIVAAGGHGPTSIWDVENGRLLHVVPQTDDANSLAFSPRGGLLAIGLDSASTVLFDPRNGARFSSLPSNLGATVSDVAFNHDGTLLVVSGVGGVTTVWNVARRVPVIQFRDRAITYTSRFSPDGRAVATGDDAGEVFFWNPRTGKPVGAPLKVHSAVLRLEFSADGRRLTTSSADGKLRLWDLATRTLIGAPLAGGGGTTFFTPDDRTLVGVGRSGTAFLWPVDVEAWKTRACTVAGRNLTHEEWATYIPHRAYRRTCP